MASTSFFDSLCNGSGARLALGSTVIVYLVAYNETCAPAVVFATFLAAIYGGMAARCKSSLRTLQMPYIRASNKFDFTCLFLATWLDALAILCACGILARTLSTCLDAMTGGLARILILGRNSPANEPWPDVLGVAVVFLVTGMFMLGLEHSRAFSLIMSLGMFGLSAVLSAVGWWNGNAQEWAQDVFLPNGLRSFLTATALLTFTYPSDYPTQRTGMQRFMGLVLNLLACISLLLTSGCLSTIVQYETITEYIAVPLFTILDEHSFHKLVPAAACLLMLTCSGAFLELFPQLYGIIVRLATSEWKILTKQISYESSDSGNPVLAVFIGGSLCAMLAFACPLQNLCYTLAASHLSAGFFRAFYLLYSPFRPKFMQRSSSESSLSYSRLSAAPIVQTNCASSSSSRLKRSLWNTVKKPKPKPKKNKQEVEKEWLLLGEPTSPLPQRESKDMESAILSDADPGPSDFDYPETDSDTSTDIDAIVDEYRQKIKVTTAGPMERAVRIPTVTSWRVTIFAIIVVAFGIALTVAGIGMHWAPATLTGVIGKPLVGIISTISIPGIIHFSGVFIISIMMTFLPNYSGNATNVSPVLCVNTIMLCIVLISASVEHSWPGILFWILGGLIMLLRCDSWCCDCFNHTTILNEQLIPSVSSKTTTIRMPRPPKGIITIPTRVNGNR